MVWALIDAQAKRGFSPRSMILLQLFSWQRLTLHPQGVTHRVKIHLGIVLSSIFTFTDQLECDETESKVSVKKISHGKL